MPRIDDNDTEGFSFVWTIHNYSYFFKRHRHEILGSPAFRLNVKNEGMWYLHVLFKEFMNHDDIGLALFETSSSQTQIEVVHCEFSVRAIRGLYRKVEKPFKGLIQNTPFACLKFLTQQELHGKGSDAILGDDDSLTLRCRIWEVNGQTLESRQCYGRTVIGVERSIYAVNLETVSNEENTIVEEQAITAETPFLTMKTYFSGQTYRNFGGDKIQVEIKETKTTEPCFITCEMALLDTNAEDKIVCSVRDEHRFAISDELIIWKPSSLPMNKIGRSEKLKFRCEIAISFSDQHKFMERTDYGRAEDHRTLPLSDFLKDDLQRFFSDGKFSDATIRTTSKDFPVHKAILCARSPVFSAMFELDMKEKRNGIVDVEDVDDETISKMLMFVYTDIIEDLDCDVASSLYYAADKYGITALKRRCSEFLKNNLDSSNVCDVLVLADTHNDSQLKSAGQDFLLNHVTEVMDSAEWKKFKENELKLASEVLYMVRKTKR